jgi:hypothetical protein
MLIPGEKNCGPGNRNTNANSPPLENTPYQAVSAKDISRSKPDDWRAKSDARPPPPSAVPAVAEDAIRTSHHHEAAEIRPNKTKQSF